MDNPLVLTFDIGTQSARGLLVTADGGFEDICQIKYSSPYFSKHPGWAEQSPDFYFDKVCEIARMLCSRNQEKLSRVIAVTITTIRDSVLCLDKDNKPLRDIILWLDKRKAEFDRPFGIAKELLYKMIFMYESVKVIYKESAANWIMQNQPDIWEKTDKFVMLSSYMNYKFTNRLVDSASNMAGHVPFDYKKKRWQTDKCLNKCIYDVPNEKLCELVKSGDVIGEITKEISALTGIPEGLPLIASGSDKGCETLGLSVVKNNQAAISFGTTATMTIQMAVKKYFTPQRFLPAYPAVINDMYNPEIQIYRGFWLLSWFIKEFGAKEKMEAEKRGCAPEMIFDELIRDIPAGSDGLLLQPFWTPGVLNPNSLGAIVGFSDFHTHLHMYRAIIEGLGYELYNSMNGMQRRSGRKVEELFIGGGGAKSDVVCQITADIFGLPVKRIQTSEAGAIGSAMVAFVSKGIFGDYDEAIKSMVRIKDVFVPDEKNHRHYMELYDRAYSKVFKRLAPVNRKILKIYKRR